MIVIFKNTATSDNERELREWLDKKNVTVHESRGELKTLFGLVGDTHTINLRDLEAFDFVEDVRRIQEPFKAVNRKFHPENTVVEIVGGVNTENKSGGLYEMIVIFRQGATRDNENELKTWLEAKNVSIHEIDGEIKTIFGLVGDTHAISQRDLEAFDYVENVRRVQEPYKAVNRKFHPDDTIVDASAAGVTARFGDGSLSIIAGPCSVESEEQIIEVAQAVKASGACMLRGGAFKPRTSPYSFQGLHGSGIELLLKAKKATGLPIVTEIMSITHLDLFAEVDMIQVGARNMQNFELLKELGRCGKPILLKRGLANTIEELLMSAEYIFAGGNTNVILCERGIRTFETMTRNTLDVSAIPILKANSHLPVIIDPSHSAGRYELVLPLSLASVAAGADGLIIEVHNDPSHALCDGAQSLTPKRFEDCVERCRRVKAALA